jgi:plastocyanin
MNLQTKFATILLLVVIVSTAMGQSPGAVAENVRTLSGEVTIVPPKSEAAVKDASRAVEWLVPREKVQPVQLEAAKPKYRIVQHDKMFQPNFLVVPVGSVVDFPNLDPWFHNVFSLYRGKKFDLGLYEAGADKQVRFDRLGASFIFCNIHPEMAAVVLAVESQYFAVSDKAGRLAIQNVPPGAYTVKVWYENATPETLNSLTRSIVVDGDTHSLPGISIPMTKQDLMKHKNKYGHDYDPNAASPVY